jgi:hypothetical protein
VRQIVDCEWGEEKAEAPPADPKAEAGIFCASCRVVLFPDTKLEVEWILNEHASHDEVYVATREPSGDVIRRGRIRKAPH